MRSGVSLNRAMATLILKSMQQAKRLTVVILGFTLLLLGILMIILPGPAIIAIPIGLGLLATEFKWAGRLLKGLKNKFRRRKHDG